MRFNREQLRTILNKVEAATKPNRGMDAILEVVACGRELRFSTYQPTGTMSMVARNPEPPHDEYVVWASGVGADRFGIRKYTSSTDEAFAFTERVLGDKLRNCDLHFCLGWENTMCFLRVSSKDGVHMGKGLGSTRALAIIAATLRILIRMAEE